MIATDPLSLVFIACIVFPAIFLIVLNALGMGHGLHGLHLHLGGHVGGGHTGGGHVGGGHAPAVMHPTATAPGHSAAPPPPGARVAVSHQQGTTHAGATQGHQSMGAAAAHIIQSALAPNLNALFVFLICFGVLGYELHNVSHVAAILALVIAVLSGGVAGVALNLVVARLFGEEGGQLGNDSSAMIGRLATVSIPIRAGGLGEVIFPGDNGTRRSLGARSADSQAIPRDAEVVIIDYTQGIATIQTWEAFLNSARSATTDSTKAS